MIRQEPDPPSPERAGPAGPGGENAFAKLEALLRKAAERTVAGPGNAIARIVALFSPAECANYFAAAGYHPD